MDKAAFRGAGVGVAVVVAILYLGESAGEKMGDRGDGGGGELEIGG
jgi:hypothetical protein